MKTRDIWQASSKQYLSPLALPGPALVRGVATRVSQLLSPPRQEAPDRCRLDLGCQGEEHGGGSGGRQLRTSSKLFNGSISFRESMLVVVFMVWVVKCTFPIHIHFTLY